MTQKIEISHRTSLPPDEIADYFYRPEKIKIWFARGDAACTSRPEKNAVEISVLQDHYLEWVFPNSFVLAVESNPTPLQNLTFFQINYGLDEPEILRVVVKIQPTGNESQISIAISGDVSEASMAEILTDWRHISKL